MMISTKGRYALRVLIDLTEQEKQGYVPLKEIAERQGISQKYLECGAQPCENAAECRTLPMWTKLNAIVTDYLDNVSIADLAKTN